MSRVVSVQIACEKAGGAAEVSCFPTLSSVPDGVEAAGRGRYRHSAARRQREDGRWRRRGGTCFGTAMVLHGVRFRRLSRAASWPPLTRLPEDHVIAGMTESCSVCGERFDVQFRYQME
jgi:hypothetical protein